MNKSRTRYRIFGGHRPPKIRVSKAWFGFLLLLPSLVALGLVIFKPLADSLLLSLSDADLIFGDPTFPFVGLENYVWMFNTDWFVPTLIRTVALTVIVMGAQVALALALGVLTDFDFPGRAIVRSLLIAPWAIPVVVAALVWQWMYEPSLSPFNDLLGLIGLSDPPIWLGNTTTALGAVMIALIWKGLPFMYLAVVAGLQQVPTEQREAARIDGAGFAAEFVHITLPNIRYMLTIMIILRTVFLFNHFEFIYLMTAGGPLDATQTLAIAAVETGVDSFHYGRAAAVTSFMFVFLVMGFGVYRTADRYAGEAKT